MRLTERRRRGAHGQQLLRLGKEFAGHQRRLAGVDDSPRGAAGHGIVTGLGEVEAVRTQEQRTATGRRLDQVLSAKRQHRPAHQGQIRQGVVGGHFTHAVAQPDAGLAAWQLC